MDGKFNVEEGASRDTTHLSRSIPYVLTESSVSSSSIVMGRRNRKSQRILHGKDNNKAPRVHKRHSQPATATNNNMVWLSVIQEDDENESASSSSGSTSVSFSSKNNSETNGSALSDVIGRYECVHDQWSIRHHTNGPTGGG